MGGLLSVTWDIAAVVSLLSIVLYLFLPFFLFSFLPLHNHDDHGYMNFGLGFYYLAQKDRFMLMYGVLVYSMLFSTIVSFCFCFFCFFQTLSTCWRVLVLVHYTIIHISLLC